EPEEHLLPRSGRQPPGDLPRGAEGPGDVPPGSSRSGRATGVRAIGWSSPGRAAILNGAMSYNAWFECINGCHGQYSLREVIYRCPSCGDLLEVHHDMEAL